ncbi:MAG TPA: hypothetical protein VEG27_10505 [Usitatibacter sp.]|nr:hypothetical protein [Usitatibacter sp.]
MGRRLMWVLWPGFVVAIPAVGVVFSLVDPADLQWLGSPIELPRLGAYTLGFLLFWVVGSGCSALTCLLQRSPFELNRCPLEPAARPDGCPKRETGECA